MTEMVARGRWPTEGSEGGGGPRRAPEPPVFSAWSVPGFTLHASASSVEKGLAAPPEWGMGLQGAYCKEVRQEGKEADRPHHSGRMLTADE